MAHLWSSCIKRKKTECEWNQWRNDGEAAAAASSDGGPGWLRYATECNCSILSSALLPFLSTM